MSVPYKIKQVLVIRHKYPDDAGGMRKLRTGKYVAQGAHASMKVFFDQGEVGYAWRLGAHGTLVESEDDLSNPGDPVLIIPLTPDMAEWVEGIFAKVVLSVNSEEDLMTLYEQARAARLPVALIEDVGNTEFHGVTTRTAIAIGPARAEDIDKITMHGTVETTLL